MDLGGSADELFQLMHENGFEGYLPKLKPMAGFEFRPISRSLVDRYQYDVVFLRRSDGWLSRELAAHGSPTAIGDVGKAGR